jgi:hypothetical protein
VSGQRRRLIETPPGLGRKQVERRTSNFQHRTSNIDGAALYLFKTSELQNSETQLAMSPDKSIFEGQFHYRPS